MVHGHVSVAGGMAIIIIALSTNRPGIPESTAKRV